MVATVAALTMTAGCAGMTAADGREAAAKARRQADQPMSALSWRIFDSRVAWTADLHGQYIYCGTSGRRLYFDATLDLFPFDKSTGLRPFIKRLLNTARADGWSVNRHADPRLHGLAYRMRKGSVTGHVAVDTQPARSNRGYRHQGLVEVNSSCFDAGPAARRLANHIRTQRHGLPPVPHPSRTTPSR